MSEQEKIQLFENQRIRTAWDPEKEEWYFRLLTWLGVLVEAEDFDTSRKYWNKVKQRLGHIYWGRSYCHAHVYFGLATDSYWLVLML